MEEVFAFMNAINPYGALNWIAAALCGYAWSKTENCLMMFFIVVNVAFGILGIVESW